MGGDGDGVSRRGGKFKGVWLLMGEFRGGRVGGRQEMGGVEEGVDGGLGRRPRSLVGAKWPVVGVH